MKLASLVVGGLSLVLSAAALAADVSSEAVPSDIEGKVYKTTISQLFPTQPGIAHRQVSYKVNRYQYDREKLFDDYCESAGQKGVKDYSGDSKITDLQSFSCKASVGDDRGEMKTAAVAPNGKLYLTDGHHTFSSFKENAGDSTPVFVIIHHDFRNLADMKAFWAEMQKQQLTWLETPAGKISPAQLPTALGRESMPDAPYRGLMYFARDVAYAKPSSPPPFLEFYWGDWLEKQLPLAQLDLDSLGGYEDAVKKAADLIIKLPSDTVIAKLPNGDKSAKDMGQFSAIDHEELNKLVSAKGKLTYAFL